MQQTEKKFMIAGAGFAILALVLDQLSKWFVNTRFYLSETIPIIPEFFNISYVRNEGAAWGMFAGFQMWLAVFAVLCIVMMLIFRKKIFGEHPATLLLLGLLIGGILGNLIDRVRLNYVIDFLDFHWKEVYHFPCFNIADSAICISAFGLVFLQWYTSKKHE